MLRLKQLRTAFATTRPSRSVLLFSTVIAGFLIIGERWEDAVLHALPMLLISLAGFCINDIFDQEQDRINHPDRALVIYPALSALVTAIYVLLFLLSIFIISIQANPVIRFVWSILFLLISNYSFFKRSFPWAKNAYIAASACVAASVLDIAHDDLLSSIWLYSPLFIAVAAREIGCDIPDINRDSGTLSQKWGRNRAALIVSALYLGSSIATVFLSKTGLQVKMAIVGSVSLIGYIVARSILKWSEKSLLPLSGIAAVSPAILVIS